MYFLSCSIWVGEFIPWATIDPPYEFGFGSRPEEPRDTPEGERALDSRSPTRIWPIPREALERRFEMILVRPAQKDYDW